MKADHNFDAAFEKVFDAIVSSLRNQGGGPFGAAVLKDGELIGLGTNRVLATGDVSRHAEIEALAEASRATGSLHLKGCLLLTSHFPCMMCYHAIKWAGIDEARFVFDTEQTRELFGFQGDSAFLSDLSISQEGLNADPGLRTHRYCSAITESLFFGKLPAVWNSKAYTHLASYDVSRR
jgi:tRNA(Arg) A34 adenosine deaminase TadA